MEGEALASASPFASAARGPRPAGPKLATMERPTKFETHRWLGDKRNQIVYDVDNLTDDAIVTAIMEAESFICFGPDTHAEARNRGYRPYLGNGSGEPDVDVDID
jgi:hypothetical protein